MTVDQLNQLINKGGAAFGLLLIAAALIFLAFRRDIERLSRKR